MAKQTEKATPKQSQLAKGSSWWTAERIYYAVIFSFSFLIYFNSVFNDYNMDDELVTQNQRLTSKGISAIPEIFNSPYYQDKSGYKYEYRPIVLVTFAIEHSIFGEHAGVSHFINVLLYALLCCLLFSVLRRLFKTYSILFPLLVTLIFAAHPVHSEVVASIKNRDEILSLLFGLTSLYFAASFVEDKRKVSLARVCFFFLLGILSKTTVITFALLIPLSLVLLSEASLAVIMAIALPLMALTVFYARLYSIVQQMGLLFLLVAAVAGLYAIKKPTEAIAFLRNFFSSFAAAFKPSANTESENETLDFSFLKNVWVSITLFALLLVPLAVAIGGVYLTNVWLVSVSLLVFAVLFIASPKGMQLFWITPLNLLCLLLIVKFKPFPLAAESALIGFLAWAILSRNKYMRIAGLANYVVYAAVVLVFNRTFYFTAMALFLGLLDKRAIKFVLFAVVVSLGFYVYPFIKGFSANKAAVMGLLNLPIIYLLLALLYKQRTKLALGFALLLLPAFSAYYFIDKDYKREVVPIITHAYYVANNIEARDLTPVQALRPVIYLETPVTKNDPAEIKLGTAMLVLGKYLKLMFAPYPLAYYYGYATISPVKITEAVPIISLLIHLALLAMALFFLRRQPVLSFAILFYLIAIGVFSNLLIPIPGMMGDRFLLIPSIGFSIFVVWVLSKIFRQNFESAVTDWKQLQGPMKIAIGVFLVFYSALTFSRNGDWKDRITLFRHDINAVENSAQAQNLLALHLYLTSNKENDPVKQQQMREEALPHFRKAMEIYPQFLNAAFDYARTLEAMGRSKEALAAYAHSITLDSNFTTPFYNMGVLYQRAGDNEKAIARS